MTFAGSAGKSAKRAGNVGDQRIELCAFLGRNGAGKTTTMRLLAGVLRPVSGGARINGHDVTTERRAAAASIGFLPEAAAGFSRLTIGELLRFCGESRGLSGRALSEAVDRVIERVHAREARDVLMGELSKGWRQRAWLAQALLHDPPVLILDEPTDGLDPTERRHVRALLDAGARHRGQLRVATLAGVIAWRRRRVRGEWMKT